MSEHRCDIEWTRGGRAFGPDYTRDHVWAFDGGTRVGASSSPSLFGNPALVDPEEAFVAALSSCHMMWFLFLAAKDGLVVNTYNDAAVGFLERKSKGLQWISRVELNPRCTFEGTAPEGAALKALHDEAHHRCFIANSVTSEVVITLA